MSQKSKKLWSKVRQGIASGTFPAVFVTAAGKLALDGIGAELPADLAALYPADIREKAEQVAAVRQADADAESLRQQQHRAAIEAERAAVIEQHREDCVWRLNGLFVEEFSDRRYTYSEISAWLDCYGYVHRHNHASVGVVCERPQGDFAIDVSDWFFDSDHRSGRRVTFGDLVRSLDSFARDRRERAAINN